MCNKHVSHPTCLRRRFPLIFRTIPIALGGDARPPWRPGHRFDGNEFPERAFQRACLESPSLSSPISYQLARHTRKSRLGGQPPLTESLSFTPAQLATLTAHYERVALLMTASFAGTRRRGVRTPHVPARGSGRLTRRGEIGDPHHARPIGDAEIALVMQRLSS